MLRSALRFVLGAVVGILLWLYLTPTYNGVLAAFAGPIVRADARLRHAEVNLADRRVVVRGGSGQPALPAILIPADQLTYNIILLLGLFATNPALLRDRAFRRLVVALLVLFVTHVLALAVTIVATYASRTGAWGSGAYGPLEQDFWRANEYGYRLVGMFGIAFACW